MTVSSGTTRRARPETIDFRTSPDRYRHWKLRVEPPLAFVTMDVDEAGGLSPGYELKLNSYDLGVDIELSDIVQRLRFEHPGVRAVILRSGHARTFCAGANIRMLAGATHALKVNFCKFTNETRLAIEDACANSGQRYLAALRATAAGGGYELALACDHIILADDGAAAVSLPEIPLLGALPGTGGLTRVVDKRKVRRDRADVFSTVEEGIKGQRALEWGLVDELAAASQFDDRVAERARALADLSERPRDEPGMKLEPIARAMAEASIEYSHVTVELDREARVATLNLRGPETSTPADLNEMKARGSGFWPLALAREFDDALLHLRLNEPELGILLIKSSGSIERLIEHEALFTGNPGDWLAREIVLYWKRVLKRLDVTSRSTFALIEPGSCFAGALAELIFAADRSYMYDDSESDDADAARTAIQLSELNFGPLPMGNGLSRIETRFIGEPERVAAAQGLIGRELNASAALEAGLVTFALDELDWEDEIRLALEERASFSPDALTGMEANLRFAGPETMETKIFGRLSAWQNWIFQRPNTASEAGALKRYGTGLRPDFDPERV